MTRHYTTVEQSKKLLEIGLSPESADMLWGSVCYEGSPENGDENGWNCYLDPSTNHFYYADLLESYSYDEDDEKKYPSIPCWSVGALLDIIWKIKDCQPKIYYTNDTDDDFKPFVGYWGELTIMEEPFDCYETKRGNLNEGKLYDSPIGVLYEMVCWLLENGYIEKSWEKQ